MGVVREAAELLSRTLRRGAPRAKPFAPTGHKDVLFVFDDPGAWTRYRCDHGAEQLRLLDRTCDVVQSDAFELAAGVDHYDTFVLNRVQWSDDVAAFFEAARERGKRVVFDSDDLVFEPELIDHFAVFDGWPEPERRKEAEKLERHQRTLCACDGATVTTRPLAERARAFVPRVDVVHNAVSREMVELADQARPPKRDEHEIVIAYLSGTRTHNRDFLEAADAVLDALETYAHVRFLAGGKIDLDERFDGFGARVRRLPMQPWRLLPEVLARIDVNLAPLEGNNPFTECKSCAKYLEAALVAVPTIASARDDFVRVIDDGRNGLLADDEAQWRDALRRLVESADLRAEIGRRAAGDVRANHTTKSRAPALSEALGLVARPTPAA